MISGVTGKKTPRYLLFGETINTANMIEAMGEAMRIHISETTAALLENDARFTIEANKTMLLKGYGKMKTSWLQG